MLALQLCQKLYYLSFLMIYHSRKQSYDEYYEFDECECSLSPKMSPQRVSQSIEALKRCPSLGKHAFQLASLAYRCHNPEVARPFAQFLAKYRPELTKPAVSTLYPDQSFPDMQAYYRAAAEDSSEEVLHIPHFPKNFNTLLDNLFNGYGYVPSLERFFMFYPNYLEKHILAETRLLESDKIDQKIVYFLAFAAAAEKGSAYMMARYLKKYFKSGGQLEWMTQGSYPKKLRPILRLNRKMSHCVWEITADMILDILENESFRWSINELAVIVQIIAFAHNDSTIALALGLLPEETTLLSELNLAKIVEIKSIHDDKVYVSSGEQLEKHEEMLEAIEQIQREEGTKAKEEHGTHEQGLSRRQLKKSMRRAEFIEPYMKEIGSELIHQVMYQQINALLEPLLEPFESVQRRSHKNYPSIDFSEYNYKFMASPILNNLTQSVSDRLQALIEYAETMTLGNFGSHIIKQTREFRKSVRYYGENLCGYTHQGYDYKNDLTALLSIPLKFYIRLLMLSPLHINKQVLKEIQHEGGQIECFDLGHIAILAATAKMTLELTLTVQAFEL